MQPTKSAKLHTLLLSIIVILLAIIIGLVYSRGFCKKGGAIVVPDTATEEVGSKGDGPELPKPYGPDTEKPTVVTINQEFTLNIGQAVIISGSNNTVTLTGFYYHPCPEGAQCIWSGLDVFYTIENIKTGEVYVKDKPLEALSDAPYSVHVIRSDYKTYATLSVEKQTPAGSAQ